MARFVQLALALLLALSLPARAFAAPVPVDTTRLSAGEPELDGTTVVFTGEAIGEDLRADSRHRWVNVLADATAVGVYAPVEMVEPIEGYGDYHRTGAVVEVAGVFNVACPQHGGDLDVHATSLKVLTESAERDHPLNPEKAAVALVAFGVTLGLAARMRVLRRRTL